MNQSSVSRTAHPSLKSMINRFKRPLILLSPNSFFISCQTVTRYKKMQIKESFYKEGTFSNSDPLLIFSQTRYLKEFDPSIQVNEHILMSIKQFLSKSFQIFISISQCSILIFNFLWIIQHADLDLILIYLWIMSNVMVISHCNWKKKSKSILILYP